jgi:hypothetical protein
MHGAYTYVREPFFPFKNRPVVFFMDSDPANKGFRDGWFGLAYPEAGL